MEKRSPAKSFTDLIVWQKAHSFVLWVYTTTRSFPKEEGFGKQSRPEKGRFLNIAEGSLEECRYYLILAHDLKYLNKQVPWELTEEIARLLRSYRCAILTPTR